MLLVCIFAFLVVPTGLLAVASGLGLNALPYELFVVRERIGLVFCAHMTASGLALICIPIAMIVRKNRGRHRAVGRIAATAVVIGGLTALPVALASVATPVARAGFFLQGITWLTLVGLAVVAIRNGDAIRHARLMAAVAAVASGAVLLRLVMAATTAADWPFDAVYAAAAWLCWMLPLGMVAIWTARAMPRRISSARTARAWT